MRLHTARVTEIQLDAAGLAAWIECPPAAIPRPGQYVLAHDPKDQSASLAIPLFPAEFSPGGFLAAPPIPPFWTPGTGLSLRGPLGRGFTLPSNCRRIALVALGDSATRLAPLIPVALGQEAALALFSDAPLPAWLPSAVEAYPLSALPELLPWADFIAIDLPLAALPDLHPRLGLGSSADHDPRLHCPAQALVFSPMPCGGLAECGVCAVPARRGWKLVCIDGPVFNLNDVTW
jgi:Iron-sulfur cluster binding domain of dihydroorotate dehydrogenase B